MSKTLLGTIREATNRKVPMITELHELLGSEDYIDSVLKAAGIDKEEFTKNIGELAAQLNPVFSPIPGIASIILTRASMLVALEMYEEAVFMDSNIENNEGDGFET